MTAGAALVLVALAACSQGAPITPLTKEPSMSRTAAKADLDDLYAMVQKSVGEDDWQTEHRWVPCGSDGGRAVQYTIDGARKGTLPGSPEEVLERIVHSLSDRGVDVRVQHDASNGQSVIGYPNGYNGGTEADGYGFDIAAAEGYASATFFGHCVAGELPERGTPLNP
jgi:hypothetical protein